MFVKLVKADGRYSETDVAVNLDEVLEVREAGSGCVRIIWRHPDREESWYRCTLDEFLALANGVGSREDSRERLLEEVLRTIANDIRNEDVRIACGRRVDWTKVKAWGQFAENVLDDKEPKPKSSEVSDGR